MNSKLRTFMNSRGVLVILSIIIIAVLGLIISIMINIGNFDNASVQGSYTGNLTFSDQNQMQLNITFDGEDEVSGIIIIDEIPYNFTSDYIIDGSDVSFSITLESMNIRFIGIVSSEASVLSGEVQVIYSESEVLGTFFLSIISS